jgi:predicted transcriptional regulator of viral defense system
VTSFILKLTRHRFDKFIILVKFVAAKGDNVYPLMQPETMQGQHYRYLEAFVDELRGRGKYSFTLADLRNKYNLSDEALKKALQRLISKKEAARVRQEFYVIVPPEYRSRGMLPVSFFIADLMKFLQKDYYVGLLTAASFYGAAHQQPQEFYLVTTKPTLRAINNSKLRIRFLYKKEWNSADIKERKVETGIIKISSPELTVLDLVTYADKIGGLNRVATVLEELTEQIDKDILIQTISKYKNIATVQRLGFLLETLEKNEFVDALMKYLKGVKHFPIVLRPQKQKPQSMVTGNRWKVVANTQIETDL